MIIKFNLFEKIFLRDVEIDGDLSAELKNMLIDGFSMVLSKKNKKNVQIKSIKVSKEQKNFKDDKLTIENTIIVSLTNKDEIKGELKQKYIKSEYDISEITIYINDLVKYDLDVDKKYSISDLIERMISSYRKYIGTDWKIS
jgi:hypothetical protein